MLWSKSDGFSQCVDFVGGRRRADGLALCPDTEFVTTIRVLRFVGAQYASETMIQCVFVLHVKLRLRLEMAPGSCGGARFQQWFSAYWAFRFLGHPRWVSGFYWPRAYLDI